MHRTCSRGQKIKRSVVSILFLDLYSHIAVITLFCYNSNLYLEDIRDFQGWEIEASAIGDQGAKKYALGLVILAGYFAGRIFVEMMSTGLFWGYLFDWWTLLKLSKLVIIGVTVGLMEGGIALDDRTPGPHQNDFRDVRALMVATSGLQFLSFILFLRNTFLPFSNFVTGILKVSTQKDLNGSLWGLLTYLFLVHRLSKSLSHSSLLRQFYLSPSCTCTMYNALTTA